MPLSPVPALHLSRVCHRYICMEYHNSLYLLLRSQLVFSQSRRQGSVGYTNQYSIYSLCEIPLRNIKRGSLNSFPAKFSCCLFTLLIYNCKSEIITVPQIYLQDNLITFITHEIATINYSRLPQFFIQYPGTSTTISDNASHIHSVKVAQTYLGHEYDINLLPFLPDRNGYKIGSYYSNCGLFDIICYGEVVAPKKVVVAMQKSERPRQPGGKTIKDELSCY